MDFTELVSDLKQKHACHTIILYGSRAIGQATEGSDIDILCFYEGEEKYADSRMWNGQFLDAFVRPTKEVDRPQEFLHLRHGRVLWDELKIGEAFLAKVREIFDQGPKALPAHELNHLKIWCEKMLARAKRVDIEGLYRANWLRHDLLQLYFQIRGKWYLGAKESLAQLKVLDPETYELYLLALKETNDFSALESLVKRVWNVTPEDKV